MLVPVAEFHDEPVEIGGPARLSFGNRVFSDDFRRIPLIPVGIGLRDFHEQLFGLTLLSHVIHKHQGPFARVLSRRKLVLNNGEIIKTKSRQLPLAERIFHKIQNGGVVVFLFHITSDDHIIFWLGSHTTK